MNVAGPAPPSNVWPPELNADLRTPKKSISQVLAGVWDYRAKTRGMWADQHTKVIHKDTLDEIAMGYCQGVSETRDGKTTHRCRTEREVTDALGTDLWIPIKRFGVLQKKTTRGVDDAADNGINHTSSRTEKLEISSVDEIIALAWLWTELAPGRATGAWALDESGIDALQHNSSVLQTLLQLLQHLTSSNWDAGTCKNSVRKAALKARMQAMVYR